ncbi:MAG: glycosyltransferase, partial [Fulvivirga sp.]|nr:glycosyltransferase [Fulvivirga sp.]
MKIGIEAQRLFRPKKHGLEIVALELIRRLQKIDKTNEYVIFVRKDKDSSCIQATENFKIREISATSFPDWEQVRLPLALKQEKLDVLHCTANTAPLFTSVPIILTLHDIIFMEKEGFRGNYYQYIGNVYRKYLLPRIINKSKKILTVSNSEKINILNYFPDSQNRLEVVYNGVNESFKVLDRTEVKNTLEEYDLPEKFILFFGNSASKKNSKNTILGFMDYAEKAEKPIPLIIAGGFKNYIESLLQQLKAPKHLIKAIGYIPFY